MGVAEAIIVGAVILMPLAVFGISGIVARRHFARKFRSRQRIAPVVVLAEFAEDAQRLTGILHDFERYFRLPMGTLRLDDRFLVELSPARRLSLHRLGADLLEDVIRNWPEFAERGDSIRDFCQLALRLMDDGIEEHEIRRKLF